MKKQVVQAATIAIEITAKQQSDEYFNKTTKPEIEKIQKQAADGIENVYNNKLDAFVKRANRYILEITTNRTNAKTEMRNLYNKYIKELGEAKDEHVTHLKDDIDRHIETLEDAAGEAIDNISGVTSHQINEIYKLRLHTVTSTQDKPAMYLSYTSTIVIPTTSTIQWNFTTGNRRRFLHWN